MAGMSVCYAILGNKLYKLPKDICFYVLYVLSIASYFYADEITMLIALVLLFAMHSSKSLFKLTMNCSILKAFHATILHHVETFLS
jgi:hypothetical protein